MNKYNIILSIFFFTTIISCKNDEECSQKPDVTKSSVLVNINRLEEDFFKSKSKEDIYSFLSSNEQMANAFFEMAAMGTKEVGEMLYPMLNNKPMDTVRQEVKATFGDFKTQKEEFEQAFSLLNYYYPETPDTINVNTVIAGMQKDLYITTDNKEVYIGLDYFLGSEATYRPNNYEYINKRFKPESILPFTMQFVSTKYNKSDFKDNSLMALMIYYGKAYYFAKKMLPCTPDSLIIGYDPMEWEGSEKHIKTIWGVFIDRELLYEASHFITGKYINERPKTPEIGDKCPGRIGQFLGWKIVKKYMENNPEVTLQELMEESDAKKIFNKSKFKPEL